MHRNSGAPSSPHAQPKEGGAEEKASTRDGRVGSSRHAGGVLQQMALWACCRADVQGEGPGNRSLGGWHRTFAPGFCGLDFASRVSASPASALMHVTAGRLSAACDQKGTAPVCSVRTSRWNGVSVAIHPERKGYCQTWQCERHCTLSAWWLLVASAVLATGTKAWGCQSAGMSFFRARTSPPPLATI